MVGMALRYGRRKKRVREKQVLFCKHCLIVFEGRANAKHCSDKCRKAAWRQRQAGHGGLRKGEN